MLHLFEKRKEADVVLLGPSNGLLAHRCIHGHSLGRLVQWKAIMPGIRAENSLVFCSSSQDHHINIEQ